MLNIPMTNQKCSTNTSKESTIAVIGEIAGRLCEPSSLNAVWHQRGAAPLPSLKTLQEIMDRLRAAIFPGYFGQAQLNADSLEYHLAANLDSINRLLAAQIIAGLCFNCEETEAPCISCEKEGKSKALNFIHYLPDIRHLLAGDAQAAYEGDPAAKSPGETIFCYPSITAMFHYRVAHILYELSIPIIPRIITEMAHSATGIDIHPGAKIGKNFFIDHGTGVVIGETAIIGNNCRIYQGVTLGALSFPKNENGTLIKGIDRHPILEDNVTVYAGATILGRVIIGKDSIIGGNVWITEDVAPNSRITQEKH